MVYSVKLRRVFGALMIPFLLLLLLPGARAGEPLPECIQRLMHLGEGRSLFEKIIDGELHRLRRSLKQTRSKTKRKRILGRFMERLKEILEREGVLFAVRTHKKNGFPYLRIEPWARGHPLNRYSRNIKDRFGRELVFDPYMELDEMSGYVTGSRQGGSLDMMVRFRPVPAIEGHEVLHLRFHDTLDRGIVLPFELKIYTENKNQLKHRIKGYDGYLSGQELPTHIFTTQSRLQTLTLRPGKENYRYAKHYLRRTHQIARRLDDLADRALEQLRDPRSPILWGTKYRKSGEPYLVFQVGPQEVRIPLDPSEIVDGKIASWSRLRRIAYEQMEQLKVLTSDTLRRQEIIRRHFDAGEFDEAYRETRALFAQYRAFLPKK